MCQGGSDGPFSHLLPSLPRGLWLSLLLWWRVDHVGPCCQLTFEQFAWYEPWLFAGLQVLLFLGSCGLLQNKTKVFIACKLVLLDYL